MQSTIRVADMHCSSCVSKIEQALAGVEGIAATYINAARRLVLVEHSDAADPVSLLRRIEEAGFQPCLGSEDVQSASQRDLLKRMGVAGIAMMQVMMFALALYAGVFVGMEDAYRQLLNYASLMFCIPVVSYSALPFFRNALQVRRKGLSMDVPVSVAIAAAFLVSLANTLSGHGEVYFETLSMFTFLLLTARYIDDRLKQRFERSNARLAALPAFALVLRGGVRERVPLDSVGAGASLWVEEGNQVPLDGIVESGSAMLDESVLTGEPVWVQRRAGETVFAGTLNRGGGFRLRATASYDRSRISGIADLADRAQSGKPRVAQLADRIARYFVPGVLLLAAASYVVWQFFDPSRAFIAALTVLVVSCPCALSLATPAAITAAMTALRQRGIVLTRSDVLEQIPDIDTALIDKTGTLTVPEPAIVGLDRLGAPDCSAEQLLDIAAALQCHANHPLARAFPAPRSVQLTDIRVVTGAGVEGRWDGRPVRIGHAAWCGLPQRMAEHAVFLAVDGRPAARFRLSDPTRDDAQSAIDALKRHDIYPTIVSGDAPERCAVLARELGVDFLARQTPETKLALTLDLQQRGHRVLMLGDGINDIPALAAADVSIAVVESSDLVKSQTDVLLISRRLGALAELIGIGRRARRILRQNLFWALGYNLAAIPVAALGFMHPWVAALGMAGSSTLVMLNAARLLSMPPQRTAAGVR